MQITFQNSAGSSIFYTLNLKNVPFRNCLMMVMMMVMMLLLMIIMMMMNLTMTRLYG